MGTVVTVVIPCYNHGAFLNDSLQSIVEQTHNHWECLIIDDGSTDNTRAISERWCDKDSRFRYYYKENGGLSQSRNYGIERGKGEYIMTLDADDRYHKFFMEKGVKILELQDTVGVVSSYGQRFSGNEYGNIFKPNGGNLHNFLFSNEAIGTSLFRKVCWEQVQGYDEQMKLGYEDWEFYLRLCIRGWEVYIIDEVLFFYRQHLQSMRTVAVANHDTLIKKYIILKHREVYVNYFDETVEWLLKSVNAERNGRLKILESVEFKIGRYFLRPLRFLKKLINNP